MVCSWSRQFPAIPCKWQYRHRHSEAWFNQKDSFFSCLVLSSAQLSCSAWSPPLSANIFRRRLTFEIIVLNLTTGQLQLQRFLRTNRNCLRRFVSQFSDRQQHVLKLTIATWNNSVKLTKHLHATDLIQLAIRFSWFTFFLLNHTTFWPDWQTQHKWNPNAGANDVTDETDAAHPNDVTDPQRMLRCLHSHSVSSHLTHRSSCSSSFSSPSSSSFRLSLLSPPGGFIGVILSWPSQLTLMQRK